MNWARYLGIERKDNEMTTQEWLDKNFKHITLVRQIGQLTVPEVNIDLTVGLISTASKEEFEKLLFNYIPVGTIIEPIDDDWYQIKLLAVRNYLTKRLLIDKTARHYLDILERRDKERWSKDRKITEIKAESTDKESTSPFNITFTVKE